MPITDKDDTELKDRDDLDEGVEQTEDELEGKAGDNPDAEDTGDETDPDKVIAGLKRRIGKLTAQKREAQARAEERDTLKARLAAYEAKEQEAAEQARRAKQSDPEWQKEEDARARIRAANDLAYGDGYSDEQLERRQERELQKEQYALNAVNYLRAELEEHGLPTDDKTVLRWERAIGSEVAEDSDLLGRFRRPATLQAAIKDAFALVNEGMVTPAVKVGGGKPIERIQRNREAVLGGGRRGGAIEGSPEPEWNPQPPKNLKGDDLVQWWKEQGEKLRARLEADSMAG